MPAEERHAPRACDRCHALKERCLWLKANDACDRCLRLGQSCVAERPARKPGRRPRSSSQTTSTSAPPPLPHATNNDKTVFSPQPPPPAPSIPPLLHQWHPVPALRPLKQMFASDNFLPSFVVVPTLGEEQRHSLLFMYLSHSAYFADAMLAVALAWLAGPEETEHCYHRASSGLSTLRSMKVESQEDVALCLGLGAALQTFALKYRVEDIQSIARHTLSLIKPSYDLASHTQPDTHRFLTCLIKSDLLNCLLKGEAPMLRYKPSLFDDHVDVYLGLSTSILPLMHDVFELSHALSHADEDDISSVLEAVERLRGEVSLWQPTVPPRFSETYSSAEVAVMLCQAHVLRATALLSLHRLTHPYGADDDLAGLMLAEGILNQLELTYLATRKSVRCVEISYLVACLELRGEHPRKLWLERADYLTGISSQERDYVKGKIDDFWTRRDAGGHQDVYLYNLDL